MKGVVHKVTRKLFAGGCLILAYKFHQSLRRDFLKPLMVCIQNLDRRDDLCEAGIYKAEFEVFRILEFSLKLPIENVLPHIQQYLDLRNTSFEDMYEETQEEFMASLTSIDS